MMQTRTPPARTGRCCSRKRGDMTRPVVLMNRDMKKWRMLVSWLRQCSCWSVEDNITPATKAPSSDDKPCTHIQLRTHTAAAIHLNTYKQTYVSMHIQYGKHCAHTYTYKPCTDTFTYRHSYNYIDTNRDRRRYRHTNRHSYTYMTSTNTNTTANTVIHAETKFSVADACSGAFCREKAHAKDLFMRSEAWHVTYTSAACSLHMCMWFTKQQ